jgi:UDP-N-acetylglucosamine 3-dehydrogenase
VKVLVLGLGAMGRNHVRALRSFDVEIDTIDPDPAAGARRVRLSEGTDADVACIATPPAHLFSCAAQALELGMDVLVEKPMADHSGFARRLADTAQRLGRHLAVGYTERYNPALVELQLNLSLVGNVRHVLVRRLGLPPRRPTLRPAIDLATHDLDALRFLGFEPRVEHAIQRDGHLIATLRLNGATASIEASHLHPVKVRELTVVGDAGMLVLDYQAQRLRFFHEGGSFPIRVDTAEPLRLEWGDFLGGGGVQPADGVRALELAEDIERYSHADASMPEVRQADGGQLLPAAQAA